MRFNWRRLSILVLIALSSGASCSHNQESKKEKNKEQARASYTRDWSRFPAIVERDTASRVVALGDVHGGYKRLVDLLSVGGLIKGDSQSPVGYSWAGGDQLLVCVGDLIDKGDRAIDVIDLMQSLEAQAPASRGEVIITLGNHEAEFLANPEKKKSTEFRDELSKKGIDPLTISQGQKPYGDWMMNRPFAARVNDWFFAHGGNTSGRSIKELSKGFQDAVDRGEWGSSLLIGDDSLLEAQEWWKGDGKAKELLDGYLAALNCKHIVFGHDPSAFHKKGEIGQEKDGRIFLIDVGMSPAIDYSKGALLLIENGGKEATSIDANGRKNALLTANH